MADAAERNNDDSMYESMDDKPSGGDDFAVALREAFPAEDWSEERINAMREAIRFCMESDYEESKKPPEPGAGRGGLALIFGPGKSKK